MSTVAKNLQDLCNLLSIIETPALLTCSQAKQKYRGMFETQKSGNKTSSGEIGLNIRILASPKVGQSPVDATLGNASISYGLTQPLLDITFRIQGPASQDSV